MRNTVKCAMAAGALAMLSACGGGGGDDDVFEPIGPPAGPAGALDKYLGSYSHCDQDHTRYSAVVSSESSRRYRIERKEITYEKADCTGGVLGTYSWSAPADLEYRSTGIVIIRSTELPGSLTVDKVQVSMSNVRRSVVGPAVTNDCITYPNGTFCYDTQTLTGYADAAMYLSGSTLYLLVPENGIYEHGWPLSRN